MALKQILEVIKKIVTNDPRFPEVDATRALLVSFIQSSASGGGAVTNKPTNYAMTAADSGGIFTNTGAVTTTIYTLPTASLVAGKTRVRIVNTAGFSIRVVATPNVINGVTSTGEAFNDSELIQSNGDRGENIELIYLDGQWLATVTGNWG